MKHTRSKIGNIFLWLAAVGLAINHRDIMAALQQVPGGADADDARAQHNNFHVARAGQARHHSA